MPILTKVNIPFFMKSPPLSADSRGLWAWDLVKAILGLSLLSFSAIFLFQGFNEESNRIAIRLTARFGFLLFALAFAAQGVHLFFRRSATFWLLMNRKYFGICFAIIHWIHLFFLLLLQSYFHPIFELAAPSSIAAGSLAYLFLSLMLLTSFPSFSKYLSRQQWKILHTFGGYWILFIFTTSYTKRFLTEWEWLPFLIMIGMVLFFRFWAWKAKRRGA